jgi:tetratricopeptide repeat protein
MKKRYLVIMAAILAVCSCGKREMTKQCLANVGSYIIEKPDSALAVLESIDRASIRGQRMKAEYALLYAMTLDKNYIDTTDIDVVMPAVKYFDTHGPEDKAMKAWFYLGREQENGGEYEDAIISYTRAKELSQNSDDLRFRALIASGIADLYDKTYNFEEEIRNLEEVYHFYNIEKDSLNIWISTGELAVAYSNLKQWDKADSLFNEFFSFEHTDSSFVSYCLMQYFYMCIMQQNPKPEIAIKAFRKAVDEYKIEPTTENYYAYAYALELSGDSNECNKILKLKSDQDYGTSALWKYYIYREQKQYEKALLELETGCHYQDSIVVKLLHNSLSITQRDYFETKSSLLAIEKENQRIIKIIFILISILVVITLFIIIRYIKKRHQQMEEEMASLQYEASCRNKELEQMIICSNEELDRKEAMIAELRQSYIQKYKLQFKRLEDLGAEYWQAERSRDKNRIYGKVKEIISEIETTSNKNSEFEKRINLGLDDVMSKLRHDFPSFKEDDYRLLSYMIVGFEAKTIATLMDITPGSVYTRKSRLKDKILSASTENTELYRMCLR